MVLSYPPVVREELTVWMEVCEEVVEVDGKPAETEYYHHQHQHLDSSPSLLLVGQPLAMGCLQFGANNDILLLLIAMVSYYYLYL